MKKLTALQAATRETLLSRLKDLPYYTPLPGERDLCRALNVSRPTLRKVLDILEEEEIIVRIRGKGSFYVGNKIAVDFTDKITHGVGLTSAFSSTGRKVHSRILHQEIELPTPKAAMYLRIPENSLVFHLRRIRYVNDVLYNLADDFIPLEIFPEISEIDFSRNSLMESLEQHGIRPVREERVLEVAPADVQEAAYLGLREGAPLSVLRVITTDQEGHIVQYATSRTDAFKSRFRIVSSVGPDSSGERP